MAITVILPKLGNSVESSLIAAWLKQPGDAVAEGEPICSVETDKTTVEVVSTASGVLLAQLVKVGDDVPVQAPIAMVGQPGEAVAPAASTAGALPTLTDAVLPRLDEQTMSIRPTGAASLAATAISPRARDLARQIAVDASMLQGSGPGGRIIERDVRAAGASASQGEPRVTPVARAMLASGEFLAPARGSGPGGQITQKRFAAGPSCQRARPGCARSPGLDGANNCPIERGAQSHRIAHARLVAKQRAAHHARLG